MGRSWYALWLGFGRIAEGWFSVVAVCWVGMWFALKATRPAAAVARTVGLTAGIPMLLTLLFPALLALVGEALFDPNLGFGFSSRFLGFGLAGEMFWLPIVWPVLLVFWARKRLQADLRGVARVRFGVRSDWSEIREAWNRWRRGSEQLSGA